MAAIASIVSGAVGFFTSSAGQEAIKAMSSVVANLYTSVVNGVKVSSLVPSTPNSPAEVATAAQFAKYAPAITSAILADIKTMYAEAIAIYVTENPTANLDDLTVQAAIAKMAEAGIEKLGIDAGRLPAYLKSSVLLNGIICYDAGIGVAAIKVAPPSAAGASTATPSVAS